MLQQHALHVHAKTAMLLVLLHPSHMQARQCCSATVVPDTGHKHSTPAQPSLRPSPPPPVP